MSAFLRLLAALLLLLGLQVPVTALQPAGAVEEHVEEEGQGRPAGSDRAEAAPQARRGAEARGLPATTPLARGLRSEARHRRTAAHARPPAAARTLPLRC